MKYKFRLKTFPYCNIKNTIIKENTLTFKNVDEVIYFISHKLFNNDDEFYYGKYFLDVKSLTCEKDIREYIEQYIKDVEEFEGNK